jgi:hypothetical protein
MTKLAHCNKSFSIISWKVKYFLTILSTHMEGRWQQHERIALPITRHVFSVCLCMCVCMCVCMGVCVCVCVCVCECVCVCVCVSVCVSMFVYVYVFLCLFLCLRLFMFMYFGVCLCFVFKNGRIALIGRRVCRFEFETKLKEYVFTFFPNIILWSLEQLNLVYSIKDR